MFMKNGKRKKLCNAFMCQKLLLMKDKGERIRNIFNLIS